MTEALHHYHRRKRIYQKHEPMPSKDKMKNLMDKLIFVIGILNPIANLPQLTKIWTEQNAAGLSLTSWVAFLVFSYFWLFYGLIHREKPIILTYSLGIVFHTFIVLGIILYG